LSGGTPPRHGTHVLVARSDITTAILVLACMRTRCKVGWSGEDSNPFYLYREHHPEPDAEGLARELTEESSEGSGLLKQPRVIDAVPIDFMSGEVVERKGAPAQKFPGTIDLPQSA
jgi:hypothetical protein